MIPEFYQNSGSEMTIYFFKRHIYGRIGLRKKWIVVQTHAMEFQNVRGVIKMQKDSLNREDMTKKNDYWVELDRKYRAQVRKTVYFRQACVAKNILI